MVTVSQPLESVHSNPTLPDLVKQFPVELYSFNPIFYGHWSNLLCMGVRNFCWEPKIRGKCIVVKIDEICRWYKRCHISEMSPQVEKVDSSTTVKTTAVRKELTLTRIGEHMCCQCLEIVINKVTLKAGTPISSFLVNLLKKWIK